MNAFEYIDEIRKVIESSTDGGDVISKQEAYQMVLNVLDMLTTELKDVEYNYAVETVDGEVITFDNFTVLHKRLNDNVIIIQPIPMGEEMVQADYDSLRDVLEAAPQAGQIKENIVILPPGISVFKAKLAK